MSDKQNWNAADYAANSSAQWQWADELIAKLKLQGNEALLDVGCGDGKITARLAEGLKNGRVVGIDLSAEMIRLANEHFPAARHPNLEFRRMDAATIAMAERFDAAFSNAVLHWVPDHRAVLRGVHACLKPAGRILFQMGGRGNAADVMTAVKAVTAEPRWQEYFKGFKAPYCFYGPEQYNAWLPACGFEPVRVELIPKDMQHAAGGFKGWLRTTWFPYTDRLSETDREPFLDAVVAAYLAVHPADADGTTHVGMVRLEIEAISR